MSFRKSILILFILICCGCTAKYNINFNGDNIVEKLTIKYNGINLSNQELKDYYSNSIPSVDDSNFLKFSVGHNGDDYVGLNFDYTYNKDNYMKSYLANECFSIFDFFEEDGNYYFSANGPFLCSNYEYDDLESLDVIFTTNHNVISNNAHEIDGNKYIWHIDSSNYEDISIIFITDSKISVRSLIASYKKLLLPLGIGFSCVFIIFLSMYIRYKRVNKI